MFLFPEIPDADYLKEFTGQGLPLRAFFLPDFGTYQAVAFASAQTTTDLKSAQLEVCPTDLKDCLGMYLEAIGKHVPSPYVPEMFNLFALLDIAPGSLRGFASHYRELGPPPRGVQDAAAHAFGQPGISAVVEVVGPELDDVSRRLFEIVDVAEVRALETIVVNPERAEGWGQDPASFETGA